jgi:hypothetical protein
MKQYILNIIIAISQLINAILAGNENEMLSARSYRESLKGKVLWKAVEKAINLVFWFDFNHCYKAWLHEKNSEQLPDDYRPIF